jgi:hypothetical protein
MPFVDLLHFKNNSTDYMSQKMLEKVRRKKKIRENISKKSAKSLKFGEKIPESREKLPGFSNPKNLRTLFLE